MSIRDRIREDNLVKLHDGYYRDSRREVPLVDDKKDTPLSIVVGLVIICGFGLVMAWEIGKAIPIPHGLR